MTFSSVFVVLQRVCRLLRHPRVVRLMHLCVSAIVYLMAGLVHFRPTVHPVVLRLAHALASSHSAVATSTAPLTLLLYAERS